MRKYLIVFAMVVSSVVVPTHGANANTLCNDGTISRSSGQGACSWHGGIAGNSRNNGFGSSSRNNGFGYSDPWGSSSRNNGFGSSSSNNRFCSYIDRSKGRC